jgi:Holliday junction resolvasome RuvABC endonuclease subunit
MIILGIDPGAKESGWVIWEPFAKKVAESGTLKNDELLLAIHKGRINGQVRFGSGDCLAVERIRGYGIVSGDDTFDTCEMVGMLAMQGHNCALNVNLIPRKDIKRHLCGNTTTNDKYVRQALIDRFGEVGTKKNPGPLFGVSGHMWSALAVAVTAADRLEGR